MHTIQIIEFLHPGKEYLPQKRRTDSNVAWNSEEKISGTRKWNCRKSHERKFIKTQGSFLNQVNGQQQTGQVTFWGEWEAQSTFQVTHSDQTKPPYYIHEPYLELIPLEQRGHNTDPYVYGENFWYTNCRQTKNGILRKLAPNSLILFGSRLGTRGKEKFYLDTVFVVDEVLISPVSNNLIRQSSEQLKQNNFLHGDIAKSDNYTFYRSLTYQESPTFFSFVPGKPFDDLSPDFHERPILAPHEDFDLRKAQRTVFLRRYVDNQIDGSLPTDFVRSYWHRIAHSCIEQGFSLITKIEEPIIK